MTPNKAPDPDASVQHLKAPDRVRSHELPSLPYVHASVQHDRGPGRVMLHAAPDTGLGDAPQGLEAPVADGERT